VHCFLDVVYFFRIFERSVLAVYRDCLKTIRLITKDPKKINNIQKTVHIEFYKNKDVSDKVELEKLKENAVRFLSNYLVHSIKRQYVEGAKEGKVMKEQNIYEDDTDDEVGEKKPQKTNETSY